MGYHHIIFDCNCPNYDFVGENCYCTAYSLVNGTYFAVDPYSCYDIRDHAILVLTDYIY